MKYVYLLFISLLISCASIGSLEGGEKDTEAPKIIKNNLTKTNFTSRQIEIEFDEYIELNSPEKNIKIFPEHTTLKFQVNKKKLTIKLDSSLFENTTYYFKIDNGIKDVHEGNPLQYDFLFSTGEVLDTGYITVMISNFKDYKNLKVALLLEQASDSLRNFKSVYTLNANSETTQFKGLKYKSFYPWVFTDNDLNNKPDLLGPIGFSTAVKPDTTIKIRVYDWLTKMRVKSYKTDGEYLKLIYDKCQDYDLGLEYLYPGKSDMLIYATEDSALFELFDCGITPDTIQPIDAYAELHQIILRSLRKIEGKTFCIQYQLPQFYQSSAGYNKLEYTRTVYNTNVEHTILYIPRMEEMDTVSIKEMAGIEEQKLSLLTINIEDSTDRKFNLFIKKDNKIVYTTTDKKSIVMFMEPGSYQIEIFERIKDHRIDPVKLKNGPAIIYSKSLILKASWEEIQTIKL